MSSRRTAAVTISSLSPELSDRFTIRRELGRGGMATVFLAHDRTLDREVAVKVLDPAAGTSDSVDRFIREIKLTARLVHPNIVPLFDSGVAGDHQYYVMPFLEGETLRQRLDRDGRLDVLTVARIGVDLCEALGYAHAMGIIHRDVKPENIFCVGDRVLLADFGIARRTGGAETMRLTATGLVVGTATYMSPEQAMGDHDTDGRSDLYTLGCVLWELLTGAPPYQAPNTMAVLTQHVHGPIPDLTVALPDAPRPLAVLLRGLMAKEPAGRPHTASDVLQWLRPMTFGSGSVPVIAADPAPAAPQRTSAEDSPSMAAYREGRTNWAHGMIGGTGALPKLQTARTWFERAITLDPDNAIAIVGLADTIHVMGFRGFADHDASYAEAQALRQRALAIGEDLAELHWSIGATTMYWEDDFDAAGRSFARALALDPGVSDLMRFHAIWLKVAGRTREALEVMRTMAAHHGHLAVVHNTLADVLMALGRYDEAIAPLRAALKINPQYDAALERLAMACHRAGKFDEAASARRALLGQRGLELRLVALDVDLKAKGWAHAREADLRRELQELLHRAKSDDPFLDQGTSRRLSDSLVITLAELGAWTQAMDWVEKGYHRRPRRLRRVLRDLPFNPGGLAVDPRYAPMLRLAGLEELL